MVTNALLFNSDTSFQLNRVWEVTRRKRTKTMRRRRRGEKKGAVVMTWKQWLPVCAGGVIVVVVVASWVRNTNRRWVLRRDEIMVGDTRPWAYRKIVSVCDTLKWMVGSIWQMRDRSLSLSVYGTSSIVPHACCYKYVHNLSPTSIEYSWLWHLRDEVSKPILLLIEYETRKNVG